MATQTQIENIRVLIGVSQEHLSSRELLIRAKRRARNRAKYAKHKQRMRRYYAENPEIGAHYPWFLEGAK